MLDCGIAPESSTRQFFQTQCHEYYQVPHSTDMCCARITYDPRMQGLYEELNVPMHCAIH